MDKKFIFFDLDGTLIDSGEGITNAIQYALSCFGIEVEDKTSLYTFIGPPLRESFMEHYKFTKDKADEVTAKYREYYSTTGVPQHKVYPGIVELLDALSSEGKKIILATSKAEVFAKRLLEYLNLSHYFTFIGGSALDGGRGSKSEVIRYAMKSCGLGEKDLRQIVMIGDSKYDIIGAKEVGIDSIGILHGFGAFEDLVSAGADFIVKDATELLNFLNADY